MTVARPYLSDERFALFIENCIAISHELVVNPIAFLRLDTRVNHIDALEVLAVQVVVECLGLRELLRMEGEYLVLVHVMDVHPDDIAWYLVVAQGVCNLLDARVGMVAVAALLVAKRPQGRHLHVAGKVHKFLHHLLRRVLLDDDHTEGWSRATEHNLRIGSHRRLPRIIGNNAKACTVAAKTENPRVTLIKMSTAIHAIARGIDIPELDGLAVTTQRSPNLAAAIKVGICIHLNANDALAILR